VKFNRIENAKNLVTKPYKKSNDKSLSHFDEIPSITYNQNNIIYKILTIFWNLYLKFQGFVYHLVWIKRIINFINLIL
jgi:hypothetical protein